MKQLNGLLKKEWISMKGWLYGSLIAQLCVVPFLSFVSTFILEEARLAELLPIFSGLLGVMFSVILPTMVLLFSLNKEMHRPDIWLHSTAPTAKLFGVKMLFSSMVGLVNILPTLIIFLIGSRFSWFPIMLPISAVVKVGTSAAIMFFLLASFIMCMGLFLGVIYQLLKPIVKGFSGTIVVMIFLLLSWLQARLAELPIYTKTTQFGQLNQEVVHDNQGENVLVEFASMEIHTGELLIDFLIAGLFFVAAITLFDKKVRL